MPSTFTLLKSPEGHYALYDDGELVANWIPIQRRYDLREYIDSQIEIRKGLKDVVVEGEGTYPWAKKLQTPKSTPKAGKES